MERDDRADDRRFARPGSDPTPHRALIDPEAHRLPPEPASPPTAHDPGPDPGTRSTGDPRPADEDPSGRTEALGDDAIELGRRRRGPLRLVRGLVVTVLALVIIAAGLGAGLLVRDARQTLTQEQLAQGVTSFRPDIEGSEVNVSSADELQGVGLRGDPSACQPLIDMGTENALGGAGWSSFSDDGQGIELQAIRYADPPTARRSLATVRTALADCPQMTVLPRDANDGGYAMTVDDVQAGSFTVRDRVSFTLQVIGDGQDDRFEFGVYVRRYGNVVTWSYGSSEPSQTEHRAAVDDLVARLRALTPA